MQLAALKRWHWILISLILGLAIGKAREGFQGELYGDWVEGFGYQLTDQSRFEGAIAQQFQGYRLFKDITVYPRWVTDKSGSRKLVHVVSGRYWSGQEETVNGKPQAIWRPTCFIAQVPYRPRTDLTIYNKPKGPDFARQFREAGPNATVLDFLSVMGSAAGVSYSYAWWDAHPMMTWTLISFIAVGLIWPTLVNLLAFGTLTRPPEAKALSLWNVRGSSRKPKPTLALAASGSEEDKELEAALHTQPAAETPPTPIDAPKPLSTAPLEPASVAPAGPSKEFGAEKEDFYPTERHVPRKR